MIIRKYYTDEHDTITLEYEEGEPIPDEEDVLYFEGVDNDDNGLRVGRKLYNKYGVITYEVLETGLPGSYDDL